MKVIIENTFSKRSDSMSGLPTLSNEDEKNAKEFWFVMYSPDDDPKKPWQVEWTDEEYNPIGSPMEFAKVDDVIKHLSKKKVKLTRKDFQKFFDAM